MIGEQPVERVSSDSHGHGIEAAPTLITLEHIGPTAIESEARSVGNCFGQCRNIAQPHIESLPGNRMDDVRGVTDKRQPFANEPARSEKPEWKRASRPDQLQVAEMQAEALFQFGKEFII